MMSGGIVPMTEDLAREAAGWRYPGEYAVYNCAEDGPLDEMLDGSAYAVRNKEGEMVGFYQFGPGAEILALEENAYPQGPTDMGLGLRPDLCGLGLGEAFVLAGMKFARENLHAGELRLTVADFNQRARKVYERCGFCPTRRVTHGKSGGRFTIMRTDGLRYRPAVSTEDYCHLREAVGFSAICPEQAGAGLAGSAYIVGCYDDGAAVGSARVLWDGGYTAYLTDVMVLPDYQGLGIGSKMVEDCLDYLRGRLRPGWRVKVHLLAGKGREGFYEPFGFVQRPNEAAGSAMDMWMEEE